MIKLGKTSEIKFSATIDTSRKGENRVVEIEFIDPPDEIQKDIQTYLNIAKVFAYRFVKTNQDGGLLISSTSITLDNGLILELEQLEEITQNKPLYRLQLRVSHETADSIRMLKQKKREMEQENAFLKREIKQLIQLVEKIETIKESYRIPFDAIKDLMVSFDSEGNVLVVNSACHAWLGLSPQDIVKKKYKSILKQNILEIVKKICATKEMITFEETVGNKVLQFSYIPMVNRKTGSTEVVMMAQDISQRKKEEKERVEQGRNEGVAIMGGTIRHILNSSLHAILGFSQLALSSYDWPRDTMVKYLRLIERTAQRMKKEISMIAEQKEFKPTKYVDIPGDNECKTILKIDMDKNDTIS